MSGLDDMFGPPPIDGDLAGAPLWPPPEWDLAPAMVEPIVAPPPAVALDAPAEMTFLPDDLSQPQQPPGLEPAPPLAAAIAGAAPPAAPPPDGPGAEPFPGAQPAVAPDVAMDAEAELSFAPDDFADNPLLTEEVERQVALSPEALAAENARREVDRDSAEAARREAETLRNEQDARDNLRTRQQADAKAAEELAAINAEAKALADREPDPRRFMSKNPGAALAGILGGMIGGYLNPGGPNSSIELMKHQIDQDLEIQKADLVKDQNLLQGRRSAVAELYAQNGDAYRSAETVRLAIWQGVDQKLAAESAKFDPRGTAAARITAARMAVRAEQAKSAAALEKTTYERSQDAAKAALDERKYASEDRARRSADARGWAGQKLDRAKLVAELEATGKTLDAKGNVVPIPGWTPKQDPKAVKLAAEAEKAVADAEKAKRENSPEDRARQLGAGGLRRKDGSAVLFRSPEEAAKVAKLKGATDTAAGLIDRILVARDAHGFSSDTMKSDEWRQMQADYAALQLQIKNTAELGVLAGPDMGLIEKALGTSDPTELRDVAAGMKAARRNLVDQFNSNVRANDVDAERYEPRKMGPAAALERTPAENVQIATQGVAPHARENPDARAAMVEQSQAAAQAVGRHGGPEKVAEAIKALDEKVAAGELTPAERNQIAAPLHARLAKTAAKQDNDAGRAAAYDGSTPGM